MKDKIDIIVIYLVLVINLIMMSILKYSQLLYYKYPMIITKVNFVNYEEAKFIHNIGMVLIGSFYLLSIIYVIIIIYKLCMNYKINLRRNNISLFIVILSDYILNLFNISIMCRNSHAFRFVIICLITNLIVYIKYKKNNIDIK